MSFRNLACEHLAQYKLDVLGVQEDGCAVKINRNRLRGSKGYVSANRLAQHMPSWYNLVDRNTFYEEVNIAVKSAVDGEERDRARKAERDAIHGVLEKYGLIEWIRGGRSLSAPEREIVS